MNFIRFIIVVICIEALLIVFYYYTTPKLIRSNEIDYKSFLKGLIERVFLMVALINGFPHALTLFGALKLATRLKRKDTTNSKIEAAYNDFYLIGNFISVMVAILYNYLYFKYIVANK